MFVEIGKAERDSPDLPTVPEYPCNQCKITSSKLDLSKYCKSVFGKSTTPPPPPPFINLKSCRRTAVQSHADPG